MGRVIGSLWECGKRGKRVSFSAIIVIEKYCTWLGLYHHLLVGQAGKSFLWKDAKSGTLWLWVRSQATAESFPFFPFFRHRRRAARRPRPLFPSFPSSSLPCASLPLFSLFRQRLCVPLMQLAFSAVRRPRPPRVSLRLPPSPFPPLIQCLDALLCWLTLLNFFSFFSHLAHADMRPRPVNLPSPIIFPADL